MVQLHGQQFMTTYGLDELLTSMTAGLLSRGHAWISGPPGAGKTQALVEFVRRLPTPQIPPPLQGASAILVDPRLARFPRPIGRETVAAPSRSG